MKSSRERNILIAVLAVAGLGLAADRVLLGTDVTGPAESTAGVLDLDVDPASLVIQSEAKAKPIGEPVPSLADRLRRVASNQDADAATGRDAFSVPTQWRGVEELSDVPAGMSPEQAVSDFRRDYHLEAVLVTGDQRCAVVNGRTLYVGQDLNGYRLLAVHERSAEFDIGGARVTLGLRTGTAAPSL